MTRPYPAKALSGESVGHICDRCNKGVRTGDLVQVYATWYNRDGWVIRRVWCYACGEGAIESGTEGADEVLVDAVFWQNLLATVKTRERSPPEGDRERAGCQDSPNGDVLRDGPQGKDLPDVARNEKGEVD